tara:strand:- start:705 stop:875 length:171 start_codon:yes stop_codon:yes gene_type:complete
MIYGYILVMVTILANGDVTGEALDYFTDPMECIEQGYIEEENAEPGVGFVCLEDTE